MLSYLEESVARQRLRRPPQLLFQRAHLRFRQKSSWCLRERSTTVDPSTARAFRQFSDRVKDDILDLPPLTHTTFSFAARLGPQDAAWYNRKLLEAQTLRRELCPGGMMFEGPKANHVCKEW